MTETYLESARKQFQYYKLLGEKTMAQLSDEQLFWQHDAESNSIALIVKHLWGNMRSRWTDFRDSDGEKPWRDRDREFELSFHTRAELMQLWQEGWQYLFDALDSITPADFERTIYIRHQGHSLVDAINRQLAHYPYHVGQIVFIGKMMRESEWTSLSIPRHASDAFNAEKFAKPKHDAHFTDEFLKEG